MRNVVMFLCTSCARKVLISIFVFLVSGGDALAKNEECLSHDELLDTPRNELSNVSPCDLLGAAFLWGWGEHVDYKERLPVDDRYQYYYVIRVFLNKAERKGGDLSVNNTGLLFADLSILPDLEGQDGRRPAYYRAFILRRFLYANEDALGDEKFMLDKLIVFFLRDGIFKKYSELECFIQSDIPTLSMKRVLDSQIYRDCLETES